MKRLTQKKNKALLIAVCAAAAAVLALALWLCLWSSGDSELPWTTREVQLDAGHGLQIVESGSYTGPYWEDGSDEQVDGVRTIVLHNDSGKDLQYAKLTLVYPDGQTAQFALTNLPDGEKAVVLESSRMAACEELPVAATAENVVLLDEMLLHEDIFSVTGADGVLTVKNTSAEDIGGDVYIYYKNVGEGTYHGGITYRAKITGGIDAGEQYQVSTQHYDTETSQILMITYGD